MDQDELVARLGRGRDDGEVYLDLSGEGLTILPPDIGDLTALTTLDLGGNQLTALPPEIGDLTNLTYLDLRNNQLTALPPPVYET